MKRKLHSTSATAGGKNSFWSGGAIRSVDFQFFSSTDCLKNVAVNKQSNFTFTVSALEVAILSQELANELVLVLLQDKSSCAVAMCECVNDDKLSNQILKQGRSFMASVQGHINQLHDSILPASMEGYI